MVQTILNETTTPNVTPPKSPKSPKSPKPPIFDESYVECNDCECYWNNSCDGSPERTERTCTAFKATRGIDIPPRVKTLEKRLLRAENCISGLRLSIVLIGTAFILHLITWFMSRGLF